MERGRKEVRDGTSGEGRELFEREVWTATRNENRRRTTS